MNGYLLDTDVISELNRSRVDRNVRAFVEAQQLQTLYISEVTLAEIRFGIAKVEDSLRRATLETFLAALREQFATRALPVTENVIYRWRLLVDLGRRTGHTFTQPDLFIAATALERSLTVVTRDTSDFEKTGVALINPWRA